MQGPRFQERKGPCVACQEPVEIPSHAARERFGLDGKARATSMSAATCEQRATQQDNPKRPRPLGCADFSPLRRCSSVTDHGGYAPSSRLGETKNRQQRGMVEYFNRLLTLLAGCRVRQHLHLYAASCVENLFLRAPLRNLFFESRITQCKRQPREQMQMHARAWT